MGHSPQAQALLSAQIRPGNVPKHMLPPVRASRPSTSLSDVNVQTTTAICESLANAAAAGLRKRKAKPRIVRSTIGAKAR